VPVGAALDVGIRGPLICTGCRVARYDPQGLMDTAQESPNPARSWSRRGEMTRVFPAIPRGHLPNAACWCRRRNPTPRHRPRGAVRATVQTTSYCLIFIAPIPTPFFCASASKHDWNINALMREKLADGAIC